MDSGDWSLDSWLEYLSEDLRSRLPDDPFDDIVAMAAGGEAFSFARYGDGEFNAIFGLSGANCDDHPYYPDLGARLRQIVESSPSYLMGLQITAVFIHGARHILDLSGAVPWVLADCMHRASEEGRFGLFLDALSEREVSLVGPEHLRPLSAARGWSYHPVPDRNCWTQYDEVLQRLTASITQGGEVQLFAASMMGNVLIDDLYGIEPNNSYIDVGSVLDPYVGVSSRSYHRAFSPEAMRQIEAYGVRSESGSSAVRHG